MESLLKLKNEDFAYRTLQVLIENGWKDKLTMLTDLEYCKRNFDMHFPVLQKVSSTGAIPEELFFDHNGNCRYYSTPITAFGD